MKILLITIIIFLTLNLEGKDIKLKILAKDDNQTLIGASIYFTEVKVGSYTDTSGQALFKNLESKIYNIEISYTGFSDKTITLDLLNNNIIDTTIYLEIMESTAGDVLVEANRSYRTLSTTPTRVEILTDEIDEAASMESSKISHLITHSTGVQVQTTSASSNGSVVRIQGLKGRYTQLLKDGFPLYGGLSSSLDIMQIAPLDLKSVEFIKGSASTLYGGGAIGGLINLVSKTPTQDESLIHLNISHIGSKDINTFFAKKYNDFGVTALASVHSFTKYDPDNDGFSDIPETFKVNINPKLFYTTNENKFYLGFNYSKESRLGGDIDLIDGEIPNTLNYYYDKQNSTRFNTQLSLEHKLSNKSSIKLKNSVNIFERFIQIRTNDFGYISNFGGNQVNIFTELNYNKITNNSVLNLGLNFYSDRFDDYNLDSNFNLDQGNITYGLYINYLYDFYKNLSLESGLRVDLANANNDSSDLSNELFTLPRLNLLYKLNNEISFRIGGGLGYRLPTIFNEESEPIGFDNLSPINYNITKTEKSYGTNFDINYQSNFGTDYLLFSLNQMFFYNQISNPLVLEKTTENFLYTNSINDLISSGFESQLKFTFWYFTWFVGYTYNESAFDNNNKQQLILTPKHSIKGDLLFVLDNKWRIGWDYEYKSSQILSDGSITRDLITTGVIVERTIENFVIFLNAENITDVRQTKYSSLVSKLNNTPQFTDIWAPLDGYFFNFGLKIKL